MVSARRLLQERADFLLGKPGLLNSALTETKNHERIPILTSQLHDYFGFILQDPRVLNPHTQKTLFLFIINIIVGMRVSLIHGHSTVEHACDDLDRAATQFIPMLAPGEAIIIGPDLPMPLPLKMLRPKSLPDSKGPQFQSRWAERQKRMVERL